MQLSPLTALLSHAVSPQDFTNSSGGAVGAGVCGVGSSGRRSSGRRSCNQANIAASADKHLQNIWDQNGSELRAHGALKFTQM